MVGSMGNLGTNLVEIKLNRLFGKAIAGLGILAVL
jgi:hypothetical protein